jgi:hypothetical protein
MTASKRTPRTIRKRLSDREYARFERQWREFAASDDAPLTENQVSEFERIAQQEDVARRIAFHVLKFSGKELVKNAGRDAPRRNAVVYAVLAATIDRYVKRLDVLKELMQEASWRCHMAMMERADYPEVMAEGKAEFVDCASLPDNVIRFRRR